MKLRSFWSMAVASAMVCCLAGTAQAAKPAAGKGCLVAEFKTLALSQNDVVLRMQQAQAWLQKNMARCSSEQLSAIMDNSPSWLGHALTPALSGLIEGAIEVKMSGNPSLMSQLHDSTGKEVATSVTTIKNPPPRAPVVQPMVVQGGLAGAVNYGNMTGPSTSIVNQTGNQSSNQNAQQFQGGFNNQQQQGQSGQMPGR